ncbi:MAG: hypothetical protein K0S47_1132 [Herbinix sp.]|nr:hypothetical protein [Herbinix sp.]
MKMNENKIMGILDKYDDVIRSTGAFFLEVDDNEVCITDSCEGVDLIPLNKDMCSKLAALFQELGENL